VNHQQWEYKLVPMRGTATNDDVTDTLNVHGLDGWQLCSIDYGGTFILRRPRQSQPLSLQDPTIRSVITLTCVRRVNDKNEVMPNEYHVTRDGAPCVGSTTLDYALQAFINRIGP